MNKLSREETANKWEPVAKGLLQQEKSRKSLNYPEPIGVLIEWKGSTYIGSIQVIVPDFSNEIVALSKSTIPLPVELDNAIRKLDPRRLALPYNLSDSMQRFKIKKPFLVHLVERGDVFEHIKAAYDGSNFWFESIGSGSSLEKTEKMREGITNQQEEIQVRDLTREERMAYSFVLSTVKEELVGRDERKIKEALNRGGAELSSYSEAEGDFVVKWKFDGEEFTTVVKKENLSVVSAGICLSHRDELFDLTSIVGVMREHKSRWD